MFPSGTIYEQGKSPARGEIRLHPSLPVFLAYKLAQGLGAGLIGFVVISLIFSFAPVVKEEISYRLARPASTETQIDPALAQKEQTHAEAEALGLNSYFAVNIPKIDARANVLANIDLSNRSEYLEALTRGVAHAKGTAFPGMGDTIFLFAHSTDSPLNFARYNAVFYLLGKLEVGDRFDIYFLDQKYTYEVFEKKVVGARDTSILTEPQNGEVLILQTCYPPGTTWQRLLILAKPVDK